MKPGTASLAVPLRWFSKNHSTQTSGTEENRERRLELVRRRPTFFSPGWTISGALRQIEQLKLRREEIKAAHSIEEA